MVNCKRYDGRKLKEDAKIVVLGSHKVGNFVTTIPLLRVLRRKYPKATIDFWGSEVTKDFENAFCKRDDESRTNLINWRTSWDGESENKFFELADHVRKRGRPCLLINCDGFNPVTRVLASWMRPEWIAGASVDIRGRKDLEWGTELEQKFLADKDWETKEFRERYKSVISDQYIGRLMCLMAFLKPNSEDLQIDLPYENPPFDVPDILIHCTTTRSAKKWHRNQWQKVIEWCWQKNISIGIVGASPVVQMTEYNSDEDEEYLLQKFDNRWIKSKKKLLADLRGKTTLLQLAGTCRKAKAVVSVDAGPLHIGAASGIPVLAVVGNNAEGIGASPINLWLPRSKNVSRTTTKETCKKCLENRFKNDSCLMDEHICMTGVGHEEVTDWLEKII